MRIKIKEGKKYLGYKEGDTIDVSEGRGNYLVSVGVGDEVKRKKKESKPAKKRKTKELKTDKETK